MRTTVELCHGLLAVGSTVMARHGQQCQDDCPSLRDGHGQAGHVAQVILGAIVVGTGWEALQKHMLHANQAPVPLAGKHLVMA
jgi:heterodisulfide reductase subunit A-like polyferredoxin